MKIQSVNQLISVFKDISVRHYQINGFYVGENYSGYGVEEKLHPVLMINPTEATMPESENGYKTFEINFDVRVFDLVRKDETNKNDVLSDCIDILKDIITEFKGHPYYVNSEMSLIEDIDFEVFNDEDDESVSGWECELTLMTPIINSFCGIPAADITGFEFPGVDCPTVNVLCPVFIEDIVGESPIVVTGGIVKTISLDESLLTDTYLTNIIYDNNTTNLTFELNNSDTIIVDLNDLKDDTNTFISSGSFNDTTKEITLTLNDSSDVNIDMSNLTLSDKFINGLTYSNNILTTELNDGTDLNVTIDNFTDINVNTINSRDITVDGTKLDNIENNADVTDTTNVTDAGALMRSGGSMTGDLNIPDNVNLNIGNSGDLKLYHDTSSSFIEDGGNGNLILLSNGPQGIILAKGPVSDYERMIRALKDGGVELYYDNNLKLDTTNTGINVTGDITVDGNVDGRDISTDGTKLDNIENNATADQTDAEIKTAIENSTNIVLDGSTTTTTQSPLDNTTKIATTEYVDVAVANVVDTAPAALDTLNELAAALGDDPNYATTTSIAIGEKLPKSGGTMTGDITFNTTQTFDGRDLSTDGTKLDNIENNADVTDTTNVTNAGALMDSEVTNLDQVKSFDSTDYQPADVNIVSDANYVSTENDFTDTLKTKLDGIELLADVTDTTNVTAAGALMRSGGVMFGTAILQGGTTTVSGGDTRTDAALLITQGEAIYGRSSTFIRNMMKWDTGGDIEIGQSGTTLISGINLIPGDAGDAKVNGDKILTETNPSVTGDITITGNVDGRDVSTDGDMLDQIKPGGTLGTFGTQLTGAMRIKCTSPFLTDSARMFQVSIDVYCGYEIKNYVVGAYLYPTTNQWVNTTCIYTGNDTATQDVQVGRDASGYAYISIATTSYTGVRVHSMTQGFKTTKYQTSQEWTVTSDSTLPNPGPAVILSTVWNSTNDGTGSGLDADKLDGQQGSYYSDYNNLTNKPVGFTGTGTYTNFTIVDGIITAAS